MTAKEIFLETIKKDGKPERLLKQYEGFGFYQMCIRDRSMTILPILFLLIDFKKLPVIQYK